MGETRNTEPDAALAEAELFANSVAARASRAMVVSRRTAQQPAATLVTPSSSTAPAADPRPVISALAHRARTRWRDIGRTPPDSCFVDPTIFVPVGGLGPPTC